MINEPVIVGCGTLGASLSLRLSKDKLVSQLKIFDFDVVSHQYDKSFYPFNKDEAGLPKVQIIKFLCKKLHPCLKIETFQEKITKPFNSTEFIIDCRDCKNPSLNSNIKLSMDGSLLYIDSRKKQKESKTYHKYIYPRNPEFIESAINVIIDYLISGSFIFNDLRLYNLEQNELFVLDKENN